jgi:hypothetical protein
MFGDVEFDDDYFVEYLHLIPSSKLSPSGGFYVKLDPEWLDISRISRWPVSCDMDHATSCHTFPIWQTVESPSSLILIDVESWALTITKPESYVALSYVWGRLANILESTRANFESLKQPGALALENPSLQVPSTVHDAIVLTKAMGQRYLWVDRLCIVQDDHDNKVAELDKMASIYARSYFTIVAMDGEDADHGLRGVSGTHSPRHVEQAFYHFSNQCSMMQAPISESDADFKAWHRRGWTFQERTMSNRNLIFFKEHVFWECRKATWLEDLADIAEGGYPLRSSKRKDTDPHSLQYCRWPDLHQYSNLAYRYNHRLLSFQSDGLNAFAAVLQVLSRSFPGGFLYCLPEFFFDYALMWVPIFAPDKRAHDFPSWSWVSQAGDMSFLYYQACDQILTREVPGRRRLEPSVELRPLVRWYKTNAKTGEKHMIDNSYNAHQLMRHDSNGTLPPGWTRHHIRQPVKSGPRGSEEEILCFRHEDVQPYGTLFNYPVPVIDEPLRPAATSWLSHLTFNSMRRHLIIGSVIPDPIGQRGYSNYWDVEKPGCLILSLLDTDGIQVGLLRSSFSDVQEVPSGTSCEIIVLSAGVAHTTMAGFVQERFPELSSQSGLRNVRTYEFYNVMWIERKDDVSYRKAVGRVWEPAWDAKPSESVDIVLG